MSAPGDILSPIFVTLKKDGSYRVIFNLKRLNQSVSYYHFKLDNLQTAIKLVTPCCYMSSIDLKDAYYSIPIAPEHQKYLEFTRRGQLYNFTCLPDGNFDAKMNLSPLSLMEVQWWLDNIQSATKNIHHRQPDIVLHTDASRLGRGARTSRHEHLVSCGDY